MEIQVQFIDGEIRGFTMSGERYGLDLIESIKPSEFFHQPLLRLQNGKHTDIFIMKAVESIFFATSHKANIREQPPAREFRTISDDDYQEKLDILRRRSESNMHLFDPGNSIDTLLVVHCLSGKSYYMQVEVIARLRVDQLMELHNRLERLTSVIPCCPEGYLAINPSAMKWIEIYPAPPENSLSAWLVQ
jgi:hypothetical protein